MIEQEIDTWYEEEKEKLVDKYLAELEHSKNADAARLHFGAAFKKLHASYERRMEEMIALDRWRRSLIPLDNTWKGVVSFFR